MPISSHLFLSQKMWETAAPRKGASSSGQTKQLWLEKLSCWGSTDQARTLQGTLETEWLCHLPLPEQSALKKRPDRLQLCVYPEAGPFQTHVSEFRGCVQPAWWVVIKHRWRPSGWACPSQSVPWKLACPPWNWPSKQPVWRQMVYMCMCAQPSLGKWYCLDALFFLFSLHPSVSPDCTSQGTCFF